MKEQLQHIFQNGYPGSNVFIEKVIKPMFSDDVITNIDIDIIDSPEKRRRADNANILSAIYVTDIDRVDSDPIALYDVTLSQGSNIVHSRVAIKQFIASEVMTFTHAFILFHYDNEPERPWRFSYVYKERTTSATRAVAKRYTYVFGKDYRSRTAIERFIALARSPKTDEGFAKAFSVETLSDEFFDRYRELYADFVQYITGKRYVKDSGKWVEKKIHNANPQLATSFDGDDKLVRDYIKKMLGRIVFLYFLQRKGWLAGNRQYMHNLFYSSELQDNFLDGVLERLFFGVLNTRPEHRSADVASLPNSDKIPYLNGGLFQQDEIDERTCVLPADYFKRLFDFFDQYNFTIDENDPEDAEIGIDPEMLGRIFENLLEDNKDKGAFYTPKEIVEYMCRESIISYLLNGIPERSHELIRNFVETLDADSLNNEQRKYLAKKLVDVKICDPAIGSGAFPMGIVNILSKIYLALGLVRDRSKMKRHIMEQNIYGVDIEKGAVDIARLRFWLAMVVDATEPEPLPNLHFKIMQGNSLLESYRGKDLSRLTEVNIGKSGSLGLQSEDAKSLISSLGRFYNESDHSERKIILEDIIKNVQRQIYELTQSEEFMSDVKDISANDKFFLWHTWFADVFANGGFDIVIGNPPYIEFKNYPKSEKEKLRHYVTAKGKYDIYIPFIERGIYLLKSKGILNYICPTRFLKRDYGKNLRRFISNNLRLCTLVDFSDAQIFENAMTYTGVIILQNSTEDTPYYFRYASCLDGKYDLIDSSNLNNEIWDFSNGMEAALISKIQEQGKTLDAISNGIIQGIATGKDSVFLVKEDVISQYHIEREVIRPFLKGKDISPYHIKWSGLYVIYPYTSDGKVITENEFKTKYPHAYHYLDTQRNELKGRGYFDKSPKLWFELWNQRKPSRFEGVKIVTLDNASKNSFSVDDQNFYGTTTVYNIKLKDCNISPYYVVGILNSRLMDFYHKSKSVPQANGFYRYQAIFIKGLPIIIAKEHIQRKVEHLVRSLMNVTAQGNTLCQQIDMITYHLYDLEYDEVLIVDPETPITREEYDNFNLDAYGQS